MDQLILNSQAIAPRATAATDSLSASFNPSMRSDFCKLIFDPYVITAALRRKTANQPLCDQLQWLFLNY